MTLRNTFLLLTIGLVLASCSSSEGSGATPMCSQNSDCKEGLTCALGGRCRTPCKQSRDCGEGGSCITDGISAVCQPVEEKNTPCDVQADCFSPLACATDYRCRNICFADADCNVLGISGRSCATDMSGRRYCAEPVEVTNGLLVATPPPGAKGEWTPWDASLLAASNDLDAARAEASTSDASVSQRQCSPACFNGEECVDGTCTACGGTGQSCCGNVCTSNLSCVDDMCRCGGAGQACCNGITCSAGVSCVGGTCACGGLGQACCPGAPATACTDGLACAGTRCGCAVEVTDALIKRADGRVFSKYLPYQASGATPVALLDGMGAPLVAKNISSAVYGGDSGFACAVMLDGTVWCWSYGSSNADGRLGWGSDAVSGSPVQVVTAAVGGQPLLGIEKVFTGGRTACAINAAGDLWCWGNGMGGKLGDGKKLNSLFATPVLVAVGGPQFTNVTKVAIAEFQVCALKGDGTVWCWGFNNAGQVGSGTISNAGSGGVALPARVASVVSRARDISANYNSSCALLEDTRVYCWGDYAWTGRGASAATTNDAAPVLLADGTTPLSGVHSLLLGDYTSNCALLAADRSVWCWGTAATIVSKAGIPLTGVYSAAGGLSYITADGRIVVWESMVAISCD